MPSEEEQNQLFSNVGKFLSRFYGIEWAMHSHFGYLLGDISYETSRIQEALGTTGRKFEIISELMENRHDYMGELKFWKKIRPEIKFIIGKRNIIAHGCSVSAPIGSPPFDTSSFTELRWSSSILKVNFRTKKDGTINELMYDIKGRDFPNIIEKCEEVVKLYQEFNQIFEKAQKKAKI